MRRSRAWASSDSKKITRVDPESPAFECASSRACAPGLGGERTESFLCQPLTFVSCAWSDELCDQRSTRDATRRATKAPTADDHLTKNVALRLTEPSVSTYLGLKAANAAGTTAPPRVRLRIVPTDRAAVAAFAAAATAMLAWRASGWHEAPRGGGGAAQARALPRGGWRDDRAARGGEEGEGRGGGRRAFRRRLRRWRRPKRRRRSKRGFRPSPRASASKPPLPPKDGRRRGDRHARMSVAIERKTTGAGFAGCSRRTRRVPPRWSPGAESVDMNSDAEIDAWLAD